MHYVDENLHDGGGIKLIYPMFGEEIALRVPLEPQSLLFEDQDVLTREYLPITVRGTMKWRIVSLEHFYLLVSTDLHKVGDRPGFQAELKEAQVGWSVASRGRVAPQARSGHRMAALDRRGANPGRCLAAEHGAVGGRSGGGGFASRPAAKGARKRAG